VILGCAQPEGEQGWNIARFAALRAELPVEVPGVTVNRLCASGLEAIAMADLRIRSGGDRVVVAGGVESMSLLPFGGLKPSPNPWLAEHYPAALLTMGLTAERVARHYNVSRADQDAFALASHRKALAAQAAGRFADELIPVAVTTSIPGSKPGKPEVSETPFSADEGPRADTSLEALAKLKPAFHAQGTVTAGNSSQTSDGAAATVLMEAGRARELGIRPIGRLLAYAATGCLPEEMGMGPVSAIPKALRIAGLTLSDIEPHRAQRGICRAGAGRHPRTRPRSRTRQRQRRSHRPRSPARLHRSQTHRNPARRDCAAVSFTTAW
jgi:acetyl-CoA acyltransferase